MLIISRINSIDIANNNLIAFMWKYLGHTSTNRIVKNTWSDLDGTLFVDFSHCHFVMAETVPTTLTLQLWFPDCQTTVTGKQYCNCQLKDQNAPLANMVHCQAYYKSCWSHSLTCFLKKYGHSGSLCIIWMNESNHQ